MGGVNYAMAMSQHKIEITHHKINAMPGLSSKSVEGAPLPLEGVHNVHGGDSLPLGVFGVGYSIPDDVLQEDLQHSTGFLIDEPGDPLDASSPGQPPDGGFGDALDVVPQHLPVPLGASLSESLASFATTRHLRLWLDTNWMDRLEHLSISRL